MLVYNYIILIFVKVFTSYRNINSNGDNMKFTNKKTDFSRYIIFAVTFVTMLILTIGVIYAIDYYCDKQDEKNITSVVDNEEYAYDESDFEIDVENIDSVPQNLSGNEIEK